MKYTAEEVRARFEAWAEENGYDVLRNDGFTAAAWHGYQTAYAERIKADEGAVAIWQYRRTSDTQWLDCDELDADAWKQTGLHEVRKLFTRPPAQAAQGETACPKCGATNPEDAATRCCPDGDSCPGCEEPLAQAWDRKAAQPAQSVDIEAIREVIESHINEAKKLRHDPESQDYLYEQADKLEAALQEKGNG